MNGPASAPSCLRLAMGWAGSNILAHSPASRASRPALPLCRCALYRRVTSALLGTGGTWGLVEQPGNVSGTQGSCGIGRVRGCLLVGQLLPAGNVLGAGPPPLP